MKKLIALAFLLVSFVAQADMQYKVEGGKVFSAPSVWKETGIMVSTEAGEYPDAVVKALGQPNKLVEVTKQVVARSGKMVDLFHYGTDITFSRVSVVYTTDKNLVDVMNDEVIESEEDTFNPYRIFWLIAIVAMFVAGRMKNPAAVIVAAVAAVVVAIIAVIVSVAVAAAVAAVVVAIIAVIVSVAVAGAVIEKDEKMYKFLSKVFYLLMAVSAGLVYYPLVV